MKIGESKYEDVCFQLKLKGNEGEGFEKLPSLKY